MYDYEIDDALQAFYEDVERELSEIDDEYFEQADALYFDDDSNDAYYYGEELRALEVRAYF